MIEALPGEVITLTVRKESNEEVDKEKRYKQIKNILSKFPEGLTAKEIAVQMKIMGYTDSDERNYASPRLTELSRINVVEPIGKRRCQYSGKSVSVWKLIK